MPDVGDLVPTTAGTWMILAPTHCPNGHPFGRSGGALVSFVRCSCGGHHEWWCKTCGTPTHGPRLRNDCRLITGPGRRD